MASFLKLRVPASSRNQDKNLPLIKYKTRNQRNIKIKNGQRFLYLAQNPLERRFGRKIVLFVANGSISPIGTCSCCNRPRIMKKRRRLVASNRRMNRYAKKQLLVSSFWHVCFSFLLLFPVLNFTERSKAARRDTSVYSGTRQRRDHREKRRRKNKL